MEFTELVKAISEHQLTITKVDPQDAERDTQLEAFVMENARCDKQPKDGDDLKVFAKNCGIEVPELLREDEIKFGGPVHEDEFPTDDRRMQCRITCRRISDTRKYCWRECRYCQWVPGRPRGILSAGHMACGGWFTVVWAN